MDGKPNPDNPEPEPTKETLVQQIVALIEEATALEVVADQAKWPDNHPTRGRASSLRLAAHQIEQQIRDLDCRNTLKQANGQR